MISEAKQASTTVLLSSHILAQVETLADQLSILINRPTTSATQVWDAGALGIYHERMASESHFTVEEARSAGEQIGVDWASAPFSPEQFLMGMNVELEHGTRDPDTNVTDDDPLTTAKIARAHLNEFPDYYTRLAKMEAEAERKAAGSAEH